MKQKIWLHATAPIICVQAADGNVQKEIEEAILRLGIIIPKIHFRQETHSRFTDLHAIVLVRIQDQVPAVAIVVACCCDVINFE